ncbi:MAG: sigma-54-dependent Fis family transcriptional regulator [Planctomycetes bacterium]|nr:sigma-54-dependent Fis family transcriptional regulator [Planctomycetota bacterium]
MITLKEAYDRFKQKHEVASGKVSAETIVSFEKLLQQDTGPLYGISHEVFHIKKVWIPDAARSGMHLLITGETGTGKDLVAAQIQALVEKTIGKQTPFLRVNCAATSPEEMELGLFGDVSNKRKGIFELAEGGCVFLDEISELDEKTLARLLRVLQSGSFLPAGGNQRLTLKARVIATTNQHEWLREDLFWRFPEHIHLPPLSKRRLDVFFILYGLLNQHPLLESGKAMAWLLTPSTLLTMLFSPWPGNVGELKNAVDMAAARYRNAPPEMPRFFTCRSATDGPDILMLPKPKYDLWRHLSRSVRETKRGRELVPAELPDRSTINDYSTLRSLGTDDIIPCYNCAEALEFSTMLYELLDDDSQAFDCVESRVYTANASRPPLPLAMRWRYDEDGNIRKEDERWSVDFSGMTSEQAYEAYLIALRERCATMAQAMQMSGLSDTTLRRHFKEHDIRQYKGKRTSK